MKMFLFTTGSMLKNLKLRTAEDCQAYVKPGVNLEELDEELDSSCGCNPGPPVKCTGLKFGFLEFGLAGMGQCEVSENCKKVIQGIDDIWIEEPPTTNLKCRAAFKINKWLSVLCINWQS